MTLPLEGVRVLDFTTFVPGQIPTLIMAEMGADVIKIERVDFREHIYSITHGGKQATSEKMERWTAANALDRSKRSIVIDLKSEDGLQILHRLLGISDVIIEQNRPGVMKQLGIDYESVSMSNPEIIYCALTGYGQDGPYSNLPGRDLTCMAASGVLSVINEGAMPPIVPGVKIADISSAMYTTIGILLALIARQKTHRGQFIDISMMDCALSSLTAPLIRYFEDGAIQPNKDEVFLSGKKPGYNIYSAKDGKYFCLAIREPWFWEILCHKLGRQDLIPYQNPDSSELDRIITELRAIFITKTRDEWLEHLKQVGASSINQFDDLVVDPQLVHRQMFVQVDTPGVGALRQIGFPIKLSETPYHIKCPAPRPGQDTGDILQELGFLHEEITRFYQLGIVK